MPRSRRSSPRWAAGWTRCAPGWPAGVSGASRPAPSPPTFSNAPPAERDAEDPAGLRGRGRGAPETLDDRDRGAQQVEVGRLARPGVVLQPDPDVPAAADSQLGQPAPHHVAAE